MSRGTIKKHQDSIVSHISQTARLTLSPVALCENDWILCSSNGLLSIHPSIGRCPRHITHKTAVLEGKASEYAFSPPALNLERLREGRIGEERDAKEVNGGGVG